MLQFCPYKLVRLASSLGDFNQYSEVEKAGLAGPVSYRFGGRGNKESKTEHMRRNKSPIAPFLEAMILAPSVTGDDFIYCRRR
jgi:hypothetical protein